MMASFASLRDFGNTSSASTWYTWSYVESTTGIKKGDRVLQVWPGVVWASTSSSFSVPAWHSLIKSKCSTLLVSQLMPCPVLAFNGV